MDLKTTMMKTKSKSANKNRRSKYWPDMVAALEHCFPKGQCRERGQALVMLAYIELAITKRMNPINANML